jgi:hypothetical protein
LYFAGPPGNRAAIRGHAASEIAVLLMEQTALRLPIRLLPRKREQIIPMVFFGIFLGFAIFWTVMATVMISRANFSEEDAPEFLLGRLFPFFGLPFLLVGAGGIGRSILKMRPGSPYYHIEVNADGLMIRSLLKQRRYAWRELPPFDTLKVRRSHKGGVTILWYTVAMQSLPPKPGMPPGSTYQREVLRILADEYGASDGEKDAKDLAGWLNGLRQLAVDNRLTANAQVGVPVGFVANAVNAPVVAAGRVQRESTVVRR